jgi:hypothetical protein
MEQSRLEREIFAPKGQEILAQGFDPGLHLLKRSALKGHQTRRGRPKRGIIVRGGNKTNSGAAFRAHPLGILNPGLKPWANIFCSFGAEGYSCLQTPGW